MRRSFTLPKNMLATLPNMPAASQRTHTGMFDFSNLVKNTVAFAKASKDGQTDSYRFIETCRCEGELARKFTAGLIKTVQGGGARASRFVQSCARTRLNEAQCAGLAELGPGVDSDINGTTYNSRTTIKSLVNRNPFPGFVIGMRAGSQIIDQTMQRQARRNFHRNIARGMPKR